MEMRGRSVRMIGEDVAEPVANFQFGSKHFAIQNSTNHFFGWRVEEGGWMERMGIGAKSVANFQFRIFFAI